jgi:hypothetical protein
MSLGGVTDSVVDAVTGGEGRAAPDVFVCMGRVVMEHLTE